MKHHERELLVYTIRTGIVTYQNISIIPPTLMQCIEAIKIYNNSYESLQNDSVMTEKEMFDWMLLEGLWDGRHEKKIKEIGKLIEDTKVDMYNNRYVKNKVISGKILLRASEKTLSQQFAVKNEYFQNTCECIANIDKNSWIIQNTSYVDNKLYDFDKVGVTDLLSYCNDQILSESCIRELCRNEPWRSTWSTKDSLNTKLFMNNDDQDLTINQKNLVIWSQLYDSIQESMDSPPQDVVNDDDLLDGWFIVQNRKRQQEENHRKIEDKLGKNNSKQEVFIMASPEEKNSIYSLNDSESRLTIRNRDLQVREQGSVDHHNLKDQQTKIAIEMNKKQVSKG